MDGVGPREDVTHRRLDVIVLRRVLQCERTLKRLRENFPDEHIRQGSEVAHREPLSHPALVAGAHPVLMANPQARQRQRRLRGWERGRPDGQARRGYE